MDSAASFLQEPCSSSSIKIPGSGHGPTCRPRGGLRLAGLPGARAGREACVPRTSPVRPPPARAGRVAAGVLEAAGGLVRESADGTCCQVFTFRWSRHLRPGRRGRNAPERICLRRGFPESRLGPAVVFKRLWRLKLTMLKNVTFVIILRIIPLIFLERGSLISLIRT